MVFSGDLAEGPLGKALLTGEHALHPGKAASQGLSGRGGRDLERHGERAQMLLAARRRAVHRLPAQFQLADRLFAQALCRR